MTRVELMHSVPGLEPAAPIVAIVDHYERDIVALQANRELRPEIIAEKTAAVTQAARDAMATIHERERAEVARPFDQEEGTIRASMKAERRFDSAATSADLQRQTLLALDQHRRLTSLGYDVNFIAESEEPQEIADALEEAFLRDDDLAVRELGRSALRRLDKLAGAEFRKANAAPGENPALRVKIDLEARLQAWKDAHPSGPERLRRVQEARSAAQFQVEHRQSLERRLSKFDDPQERATAAAGFPQTNQGFAAPGRRR